MKRAALLVLCGLILFLAAVVPGAADSARPRIDPNVLQDVANGQDADFLVVLKTQSNTRAIAARAPNRQQQRQAVFSALRQTASSTQSVITSQLRALGAEYQTYWIANVVAVHGNSIVLAAMAARSDVLEIESNGAVPVSLEQPSIQSPAVPSMTEWNISQVGAPGVWAHGITGRGIVYANADTGVQWDHPALKSHYRGWNGIAANHNYNWWDAIKTPIVGGSSCGYNTQAPCDDYGHGTHTMGTAIGDDGAGNRIGMAPGAQWIACRNMDRGTGRPSTYIDCLQFLMAPTDLNGNNPDPTRGADVVGNSYICPIGSPPSGEDCAVDSLQTAVDNMRAAGIFMAVSAGNSGPACSTISEPPSFYASAITVGATDSTDTIASFSSRGPVTVDSSNRVKPELVAPGVNVRSSYPTNTYVTMSGTSMSAPDLGGAVALLWSAFPPLDRNVDLTETLLEQTAVPLTTSEGCGGDTTTQIPNNVYGYGRINVLAAYNLALEQYPFTFYLPFVRRDAGF